jgi:GalNAc5-diNAcBac-PP-undecaprenol beta-1,3-glucosyltransferase
MRIEKTLELEKIQVSIIMATYNRAHFIEETLISIQNQTYKDWECIIVDDGSIDNTSEILKPYLINDVRFKYVRRSSKYTKGLPGCRNHGLDLAKGDCVIFFDDDDIVHPDNLQLCVNALNKYNVDYIRYRREVFTGIFSEKFDRSKDINAFPLDRLVIEKMIIGIIPFNSCQILWSKECFSKVRYNEDLMYAEEWECYSRILVSGVKGVSLDKTLFFGRKHIKSNTGEYNSKNILRVDSHIMAALLVLDTLKAKNIYSDTLKTFFIRLSLELNSYQILKKYLKIAEADGLEKIKYFIGYKIYPFMKPFFYLKAKFKKD